MCEGQSSNIRCPPGTTVSVTSALYGSPEIYCPAPQGTCEQTFNATDIYTALCSGKESCLVESSAAGGLGDPCGGVVKYVEIKYTCGPPGEASNGYPRRLLCC